MLTLKNMKLVLIWMLVLMCSLEIGLRLTGATTFTNEDYSVESSPKNAFVGDSLYGIKLNLGNFKVTLNDSLVFNTTHLSNNERLVSGANNNSDTIISVFGCSFTYGYGVENDEHFTSKLQKRLPKYKFHNMGVVGYGTIQSLLQLKALPNLDKTKAAILTFSDVHFERNTLLQSYRSALKIGFGRSSKETSVQLQSARFPYVKDSSLQVQYVTWDKMYENWWFREYSATINSAQVTYDKYSDNKIDSYLLTSKIIEEMNSFCTSNTIQFGIIYLDDSERVERLKAEFSEIPSVSVHFDFSDTKLTNAPYDNHPNYLGHNKIAKSADSLLNSLLSIK